MVHFRFSDPTKPVKVPIGRRILALARIAWGRLLPVSWTLRVSTWLSHLDRRLRPGRRQVMITLLEPFVPPGTSRKELERQVAMARAIRRVGARTYAPVFRRSRDWLLKTLQPEGLEHLEEVKRTGGAIVLGTHAGLTGWVGPVLHQLGYPVRLTQRERITAENFILMGWDGLMSQVLPYPEDRERGVHLKALHDMLRAGEWLQHVGDYPDPKNGLEGKYLGFQVRLVRAPWILARLAERPVVPVLLLMDGNFKPKFIVARPIWVSPSGDATVAMSAALQTYLDFATEWVLRMPWNLNLVFRGAIIGERLPPGWEPPRSRVS